MKTKIFQLALCSFVLSLFLFVQMPKANADSFAFTFKSVTSMDITINNTSTQTFEIVGLDENGELIAVSFTGYLRSLGDINMGAGLNYCKGFATKVMSKSGGFDLWMAGNGTVTVVPAGTVAQVTLNDNESHNVQCRLLAE